MTPHPHEEIQGELFGVELESARTTDALTPPTITAHFIEHDGGLFPEASAETPVTVPIIDLEQATLATAIHAEALKRKHHTSQLGKHSPLQRAGTYLAVQVGDVLPGFDIVTYRNFDRAVEYAQVLEAQRLQGNNS